MRFSGKAAQFIVTSGPDQRDDRWWRRSAISSLPVPRSPITSTGRFNGAARLARSTASRKARLCPTNWLARSIKSPWSCPRLGGKSHHLARNFRPPLVENQGFFRESGDNADLALALQSFWQQGL